MVKKCKIRRFECEIFAKYDVLLAYVIYFYYLCGGF